MPTKEANPEGLYQEKLEPNLYGLYNTLIDDMRQVNEGNDPEEGIINLETHIGFMEMLFPNCKYQLFLEENTIDQFSSIVFYNDKGQIASISVNEYYS